MEPQRIAVVDIGTNSTRLLVADVAGGEVTELERRSEVTGLGQGVDATNRLADEAVGRVFEVLGGFRELIDRLDAKRVVGVATSAVRDAENGGEFRDAMIERFGIDARTISGDEEARLTFRGATAARPESDVPTMVLDIGGGSTELVVGVPGGDPSFHVSTKLGSVRQTERHIKGDPPEPGEVQALAADARAILEAGVPAAIRDQAGHGIAVAGTATSLAAIELELDPYDPDEVHGYRLSLAAAERILAMLAAHTVKERRGVTGLDPARAPTIVAGAVIFVESMRVFGLDEMEISEADILHGAALAAAEAGSGNAPG